MMQVNVEYEPGREDKRKNVSQRVFSDRMLLSTFTLYRKYQGGEIISRTFFQRKVTWDNTKKSKFVESMLLDIPIPLVYMMERSEGKIEVIDGQQRLEAVFDFFNNQYPLTGLTRLKHLNGKNLKDLKTNDTTLQRKLEDFQIPVMIIKNESPPGIDIEIFKRLNQ
jgi:hypothetical protein